MSIKNPESLRLIRTHLEWMTGGARVSGYGPDDNAMWMSSVDLRTGRYPQPDLRPAGVEKRCYRWIESPMGSNAYWDQPLLAALCFYADLSGWEPGRQAVRSYVGDFLDRCRCRNGLFLWGNHYYYEASLGRTVWFTGIIPPTPIDPATEEGRYHETRPLPVAWGLFNEVDSSATEAAIRAQGILHRVDPATGEFNRHADQRSEHAFVESGGILAATLCWLGRERRDPSLFDQALQLARFSHSHRDPVTGLMSNSPTKERWDKVMTTSECGMWAGCLQKCAEWSGRAIFDEMAESVLEPWLHHAWDNDAGAYYGKLLIEDGKPVLGEKTTSYQPGEHCDLWEPLFPAHDYPFPCAEACLRAWKRTGRTCFRQGVERWVRMVEQGLPARDGRGAYAEHYGRCLHFLDQAADHAQHPGWHLLADRVEAEAREKLLAGEYFRTHPGEDRCDAVDGLGWLFLALLERNTGEPLPDSGLFF